MIEINKREGQKSHYLTLRLLFHFKEVKYIQHNNKGNVQDFSFIDSSKCIYCDGLIFCEQDNVVYYSQGLIFLDFT